MEYLQEDAAFVESNHEMVVGQVEHAKTTDAVALSSAPSDNCISKEIQVEHDVSITSTCSECIQLDLELQKTKAVVLKLQNRCAEKTAEIKRLRAAEKRSKLAKSSLNEILRELKENKWISSEGEDVLNVRNLNL